MALRKDQDKLYTADEFLAMTDLPVGSELIDGRIVNKYGHDRDIANMSPAPGFIHQKLSSRFNHKILSYIESRSGNCEVLCAPFDVKLDDHITVQPDVFVVCDKSKFNDILCNGAPDWVIEIVSPSNAGHDYVDKLKLYSEHGVKEYWIVDPSGERVLVYIFEQPNTIGFYTFDDDIPVWIYRSEPEQLSIRISDLL